jgi:hypothetical protein
LKDALTNDIETYFAPMRAVRESITDHEVARVLKEGKERARSVSNETLKQVRDVIGITM